MSFLSDIRKPIVWVPLLLSTIVSAYFWWVSLQYSKISYLASTVTVFDQAVSGDSVKVMDKSDTVLTDSVFVSEIVVWNSGNAAIEPNLVRRPVVFTVSNMKRLLDFQLVSETHDRVSKFRLTKRTDSNVIELGWTHFDPGEGCKVRLIYTSTVKPPVRPSVRPSGIIFGVRRFREYRPEARIWQYLVLAAALIGVFMLPFMFHDLSRKFSSSSSPRSQILIGVLVALSVIGFVAMFVLVAYNVFDIFFSNLPMPEL